MPPNRNLLDQIRSLDLNGKEISISWNGEVRRFTLKALLGSGQTAVAWHVENSHRREYAVKFVLKSEYKTHSLDEEACHAGTLTPSLFARIDYFGDVKFHSDDNDLSGFYAIVVEWVNGRSLKKVIDDKAYLIDGSVFFKLSKDFCGVLQELRNASSELTHNDLHDENILLCSTTEPLSEISIEKIKVIDTGQLKTIDRRDELLDSWRQELATLMGVSDEDSGLEEKITDIKKRIHWFERTDQEWIVFHLCSFHNKMLGNYKSLSPSDKRFVQGLPDLLAQMVDPDPSRRLSNPRDMFQEIENLYQSANDGKLPSMTTPFDLPSAELIRSDRQLMDLFSEEYPQIEACRSYSPIYLYGPRGSGKSTILRSLSFKAMLASQSPEEELKKIPFLGVYLSSSQELRSRFWLMNEDDFSLLEAHVILYFNLLLLEALIDTLDLLDNTSLNLDGYSQSINWTENVANIIRKHLRLENTVARYAGTSVLSLLKHELRRKRDDLWSRILDKSESKMRTNAQLVFDIVKDLEEEVSFLKQRRIVFLIDDYSNQRIPKALQKRLNQAITFSKQGTPIFKVTSEYGGVDLEGVQEGREVHEVNIGFEYVKLTGPSRYSFLQSLLEKRFRYCKSEVNLLEVLPLSGLSPGIPMAKAIREASRNNERFYYHGLDTISDLCSGDIAMGIDVVRRIFEYAKVDWKNCQEISEQSQDRAIREYTKLEYEYIRHQSQDGRRKYEIADRLCWLSKECILEKEVTKGKEQVPLLKNHIDISESAIHDLESEYPESAVFLEELIRSGILFPLQSSRSREKHDSTRRYMTRRILLTRYGTALGRNVSIRIDDVQRLQWLLTNPTTFVSDEIGKQVKQGGKKSQSSQLLMFKDDKENKKDG